MDFLIIGAGLSGAILARQLANKNQQVLILESRPHVGGHCYDAIVDGVNTHIYGPHIFHTKNKEVLTFMSKFWELNNYHNRVLGKVENKLIPIPFNFEGIDQFFVDDKELIKKELLKLYKPNERVSIAELQKINHPLIKRLTNFVYQNIFENYTKKMWGIDPQKIDPHVLKRVPIVIGYDDRYFNDPYEGIPKQGYTKTILKILDHPLIKVKLNTNGSSLIKIKENKIYYQNEKLNCPLIFTGAIDELFDYRYGLLEYRSLNIVFETLKTSQFQKTAVVNYPADPLMTRISEYKHFDLDLKKINQTVISREYPGAFSLDSKVFNKRFYPMMNQKAKDAYQKYFMASQKVKSLHLLGRLATFKYINMDQAISLAIDKAKELLKEND